jgi:hypothetical protein
MVILRMTAAAAATVAPALALGAHYNKVTRLDVESGAQVELPSSAISQASRVPLRCTYGAVLKVRPSGTGPNAMSFTCGDDPRAGEVRCADPAGKMRASRGLYCE